MLNLAKERLPDLTEFYTTGEGFASWNHKVALWTQHRPQYHYPEIELKLGKDNSPSLLDPSVVPYINDQKVGSCLRILINSDNHHLRRINSVNNRIMFIMRNNGVIFSLHAIKIFLISFICWNLLAFFYWILRRAYFHINKQSWSFPYNQCSQPIQM